MKETDFSYLPVIAFSDYNEPETKHQAKDLGVSTYLVKTNYTTKQIIEKIKNKLNKTRL